MTRFELFGGKGGTGKTTCAAARAVSAARAGARVLAVSTDPAHSLADALDVPVPADDEIHGVELADGGGDLGLCHVDAAAAWRRWLADYRASLHRIAEGGTYLDREDVEALLALPVPGADELIGLLELLRLHRRGAYDLVVVDSAPTGQMLRLLDSPTSLERVARLLEAMQEKRRTVAEALTGRALPRQDDDAIDSIEADSRAVAELLRDREITAVRWVCLAERMSLTETLHALDRLARAGIPVTEVICNRIAADGARARAQRGVLRRARRELAGRTLRTIPETAAEPRGIAALQALAKHLDAPADLPATRDGADAPKPAVASRRGRSPEQAPPWLTRLAGGRSVLFFGGKGGTGKSTCAAAVAVRLAAAGDGRVLLVSTDPAQSLATVLGGAREDREVPGAAGLDLRQLDPESALQRWRERYGEDVADLLRAMGRRGGAEARLDREVIERFLDTPPPGMDEILALASLLEIHENAPGPVICDTAPTGHALRLLQMPDVGLAWDHALIRILLKYREILQPGRLAAELVALSRRLGRFRELIRDPERCGFVVVARAGRLPALETARLLEELARRRIHVPALILNAVREDADEPLQELRRTLPDGPPRPYDILLAPERQPPPHGAADLADWLQTWSLQPS